MKGLGFLSLAFVLGCAPTVTEDVPQEGEEGGECYGNQTCNGALTCASNICVNLGTGGSSGTGQGGTVSAGGTTTTGGSSSAGGAVGVGGTTETGGNTMTGGVHGSGGSSATCVPNCSGRSCGPDPICQTSCGSCAAGLTCSAGVCISPIPLKANGDTCSAAPECASGICESNVSGEFHCYGTAGPDTLCTNGYNCRAGVCEPVSLSGTTSVCTPGLQVCLIAKVPANCNLFVITFCELVHDCGSSVSADVPASWRASFNTCINDMCAAYNGTADSTCDSNMRSILAGTASCP